MKIFSFISSIIHHTSSKFAGHIRRVNPHFQILLTFFIALSNHLIHAQVPFIAIYAEEIPIPVSIGSQIDATLTNGGPELPKCYRLYVCLSNPNWELQAIYGGDGNPLWTLNTNTEVYQDAFGSHLASDINSTLFGVFPKLQYDSWFTIQADESSDPGNILSFQDVPSAFATWETTGGNFNSGIAIGSAVVNLPGYPSTSGKADAFNRILIGQITTDGSFSGSFNFQFRKLNPNGSLFIPNTVSVISNASFDLATNPTTPCFSALPVELTDFHCEQLDSNVQIQWTTLSEKNNAYFLVERSPDMLEWQEIARRTGAGNSLESILYECTDDTPLDGKNYYRLLQYDFNGRCTYSSIDCVTFKKPFEENGDFFPNPSDGSSIHFTKTMDEIQYMRVYEMNGQLEANEMTFEMSTVYFQEQLRAGNHLLICLTKNGEFFHQVITTE